MPATRVKDAGFLELHIEKILLGVGLLILLGAVVIFFVGNPFKIVINDREYASSREAIDELILNDSRLESGLLNNNQLTVPPTPQFDAEIASMLDVKVDRSLAPARFAMPGLTDDAVDPEPVPPPRYAEATPPVPTNVKYKHGPDVLDTQLNRPWDEFTELVGTDADAGSEPVDLTMMIAAGDFEIWEWAKKLQDAAENGNGVAIPAGIWSQRFGVAGVVILREEWSDELNDWTNRRFVEPLPNQSRLMPSDTVPNSLEDLTLAMQTLQQLRESRESIARPDLPWLGSFEQAIPPGDAELDTALGVFDEFGQEQELGPAQKQIQQLEEKIQQLQERQRIQQEREANNARPDRPIRQERPEARPDRRDDREPRADPIARQIERFQSQIEKLRERAEREQVEREKLLREREQRQALIAERERILGDARRNNQDLREQEEFGDIAGVPLKEGATVRVWAADLTMQPGKTYRYKLLVAAINPLYAVPRLAPEQLQQNVAKAALLPSQEDIDAMPWSEPITVEPEKQFYFVSGTESRGKVEVYRRVNGEVKKKAFDVAPGDVIGGVVSFTDERDILPPQDIDMSVDAVLVDIINRPDPLGGNATTMVYMDDKGQLYERSQSSDFRSEDRAALEEELKTGTRYEFRPQRDLDGGSTFGDDFGVDNFGESRPF